MDKIYSGEAYEILPLSNGIIYSYNRESLEDGRQLVSYKMVSFENGTVTDAGRNIYLITKFGNNYREIVKHCENYVMSKSVLLHAGRVLVFNQDGEAFIMDNDGEILWSGSLLYRSTPPSDAVLYKNSIWISYEDCNAILRYNLSTMREELRIGGNKSPFNCPTDLFLEGDNIIVSNKGSRKILSVNLNTYSVTELESFEEELRQYVSVKNHRFALLESGIYLI